MVSLMTSLKYWNFFYENSGHIVKKFVFLLKFNDLYNKSEYDVYDIKVKFVIFGWKCIYYLIIFHQINDENPNYFILFIFDIQITILTYFEIF